MFLFVCNIPFIDHYLDDFFFLAEKSHNTCSKALNSAIDMCQFLNVPFALDKLVGPTTKLTYLDIQIDSVTFFMSLPKDKIIKIKQKLNSWPLRDTCVKKDLLSLIGLLSFACKVIKPGRTFLRRLIDLSTTGAHFILLF